MALPQLAQLVALLVVHWVADFVVQSRWMAINKSKRLDALVIHVTTYTLTLLIGSSLILGVSKIALLLLFVGANGLFHLDTSMVRVHQHAACIADSGNQAVGRSRGGLTSKLHVVFDGDGKG